MERMSKPPKLEKQDVVKMGQNPIRQILVRTSEQGKKRQVFLPITSGPQFT